VRPDAYQLRNLSPWRKILESFGLFFFAAVFVLTWVFSVRLVQKGYTGEAILYYLGNVLTDIRNEDRRQFLILCAGNLGSMTALFLMSQRLFRRSALRQKVRFALTLTAGFLTVLNTVLWASLRFGSISNLIMGPVSAFTSLVLLCYVTVPFFQMWIYPRWRSATGKQQRVVIVGGGFAGLYAAMALDRELGHCRDLELTVIDQNNYFLFPPLLPSAATGAIETRQVTFPFRRIFETTNIVFRKAEVKSIDPERQVVVADTAQHPGSPCVEIPYDYLILSPGSISNTFRTRGAAEYALFMRQLGDALAVRDQIIDCFERAAASPNRDEQAELLCFVIVGAGPTGVELASEIHDLIHHVLLQRYPEIDSKLVEILLVQSGPQVLPGWHKSVVEITSEKLKTLDIQVLLDNRVKEVAADHIVLKDGAVKRTRTCVWCAGVRPSPLLARAGVALHESGRVLIEEDLRAKGRDNLFVLGDAGYLVDKKSGQPLPPLGQVAFQQGPHAARNIMALLRGQAPKPFLYFNFGSLVSVGEHFAAVDLLGIRLSGFFGWFMWRTLYLVKVVGLSNRIRILIDWTLDLLIERSFTQIQGRARELGEESAKSSG
jgi:NADH dehydrogenase